MRTKEEVIKSAWGEKWNDLPTGVQITALKNNGYVSQYFEDLLELDERERKVFEIRPKSLSGIEDYYSFVDIKGFENYKINKQGLIISKSRISSQKNGKKYTVKEKIMKPQIDNTGYIVFGLTRSNKTKKKVYLHRVLAESFIPNEYNKPCVNHKNGVKYDNSLSNLEWCTYKENNTHAFTTGLNTTIGERLKGNKGDKCHNYGKGKKVYSPTKIYNNMREAAKDLNLTVDYLYQCLCGACPNKHNLSYEPITTSEPPLY